MKQSASPADLVKKLSITFPNGNLSVYDQAFGRNYYL